VQRGTSAVPKSVDEGRMKENFKGVWGISSLTLRGFAEVSG
jgi:hypothetical protein